MRLFLNINQSLEAIKENSIRAGVTIFIIALGITALIVVMTSIEGVKVGMLQSFSSLGSNTFNIKNYPSGVVFQGGRGRRVTRYPQITYRQAEDFKNRFQSQAIVSISGNAGNTFTLKHQSNTSNANIQIMGADENYIRTAKYTIAEGRAISDEDVTLGKNVIVLGSAVKDQLFPNESPIGKIVTASGNVYKVIGVFAPMGSMGMFGGDKITLIPITTARNHYPYMGSLDLNVFASDANRINYLIEEARGVFRLVRSLRIDEEDNFGISKSDSFVNDLLDQMGILTISAQVIALITLLGASIALLNVMLVSVTERTREIGLRKAVGARKSQILMQFLMEAVVICQIGGILGVLLGLALGNIFSSMIFSTGFVIPWNWTLIGLISCLVVGVGSGYYPAWKAARVDPIESLRELG